MRRCTPRAGRSSRPSPHLRSEVAIVCGARRGHPRRPARRRRGRSSAPTTTAIRDRIARVVPGFDDVRREGRPARRLRAAAPAARHPHVPDRDRQGRSSRVSPTRGAATCPRGGCCCRRCAATTSSTPRSTASTTATAASTDGRRVVFVHPDDIAALGLARRQIGRPRQRVEGRHRSGGARASGSSPTTRRAAAPPPTTPRPTPLVPLDSTAEGSNQPASKSVVVRLEPHDAERPAQGRRGDLGRADGSGSGDEAEAVVQPHHRATCRVSPRSG